MRMNIIVALDSVNGIGKDGTLPWNLPRDVAHFNSMTTKTSDPNKRNAVLMGRKVWESIPAKWRPLKGRFNVVLSKTMTLESNENVVVERSFEDAVERLCSMSDIETIWNIGGSAVYAKGLQSPLLHQLFLTRVEGSFNADVFFPKIDYKLFGEPEQTYPGQESEIKENNISYRFETLTKKQN